LLEKQIHELKMRHDLSREVLEDIIQLLQHHTDLVSAGVGQELNGAARANAKTIDRKAEKVFRELVRLHWSAPTSRLCC
jgi:hypothetical protein